MSLESEINKHIINKLEQERDMYKQNWGKMIEERNTLIEDIRSLRKLNNALKIDRDELWISSRNYERARDILRKENERLSLQEDNYFGEWKTVQNMYNSLTNHIRQKAEANPNVDRYIALVNYIDNLEGE